MNKNFIKKVAFVLGGLMILPVLIMLLIIFPPLIFLIIVAIPLAGLTVVLWDIAGYVFKEKA